MLSISKFLWLKYRLELLILVIWAGIWVFYTLFLGFDLAKRLNTLSFPKVQDFNFESLGQGPFSLNPQYLNPNTPKILDCVYAAIVSKLVWNDQYIHIGIENSDFFQPLKLNEFTTIRSNSLDILSQWSLKPVRIDKDMLIVEAKHNNDSSMIISLPLSKLENKKNEEYKVFLEHPGILQLKNAKFIGVDQLTNSYDPDSLENPAYRICFDKNKILPVKPDQELYFYENQWTLEKASDELRAVLIIEDNKPFVMATDRKGLFETKICLTEVSDEIFNHQLLMPTKVKGCTNKTFSCFIGSQKFFLKENDWVLKIGNFSQVLKQKENIISLLNFKKTGLLLVIDEVSSNKTTCLIRGKIFSPLRMKVHSFEFEAPMDIPIKKTNKKSSKGLKKA